MLDITISDFLSLSPGLLPVDICIVQLFASSPYPEVRKSRIGIAEALSIDGTTVYRSVKRLEALALLSVKRFPGGSKVNRYKLDKDRLLQLIQDMGDFVAFGKQERDPLTSEWLKTGEYLDKKGKVDLFRLVCDYPSFQDLCKALEPLSQSFLSSNPSGNSSAHASLSDCLSDSAKAPVATLSDLQDSEEPAEPQTDPQYLTLAQQVEDGKAKPGLLQWLKIIKMLSPSGKLDLPRLTTTFPSFQDFCSAFEQRITADSEVENETCSMIDGLNVVQFPAKKQDSTADIINSLGKHFDLKGV